MNRELNKLKSFTVDEFQSDFDNLMNRVENGESFIITSENGNGIIMPYKEVLQVCEKSNINFEEIIRIHTDHEEGS